MASMEFPSSKLRIIIAALTRRGFRGTSIYLLNDLEARISGMSLVGVLVTSADGR